MGPLATGLWSLGARVVGRLGSWRPATWRPTGPLRVLVIAPHPDDEMGCAGTLVLHARAGDTVRIVHVTDGRASRAGGLSADAMAARRRSETAAAAAALGIGVADWLGAPEGRWQADALLPMLEEILRRHPADLVYAPSRVDFHPEHVGVARVLAQALLRVEPRPSAVRVYQIQVPLTPVLVNLVAPVHDAMREIRAALECYVSQRGSVDRLLRMKRYASALYGAHGALEEFWEMRVPAYHRLHASPYPSADDPGFRSVRARPWSDPAAYLVGWRARRSLRADAEFA